MQKNLEKHIARYVHEYASAQGPRWRVCLPDGRGGQVRKRGFESRALALSWTTERYTRLLQTKGQVALPVTSMTFDEFAKSWLESRKSEIRSSTYVNYLHSLQTRILPFFGAKRLVDINKGLARQFLYDLMSDPKLNNTTRRKVFFEFKRIIKDAERDDLIPPTGIGDLKSPKPNRFEAKFWDEDEMNTFLAATREHPQHDLWKFALFTGLRAGEIAALKWECVQLYPSPRGFVFGCLQIKRTRCQKSGEIRDTTKNGDRRIVPILQPVAAILQKPGIVRSGFIFGGAAPIDQKHLARELRVVSKHVGVKPISFHQLRHSFCSWMDSKGLPRRLVAEIMGHRDLATTNRYSHISDNTMLKMLEDFSPLMGAGRELSTPRVSNE